MKRLLLSFECLKSRMTSLSSDHGYNSPSHTVYVTLDEDRGEIIPSSLEGISQLQNGRSACAFSNLIHQRSALFVSNPGYLLVMEAH